MESQATTMGFFLFFSIINFSGLLILFAMILFMYNKFIDNENSILDLQEYRKRNEVQLQNLVKDVNSNDEYLNNRLNVHNHAAATK